MAMYVGGQGVSAIQWGSQPVREVYLGSRKIWPTGRLVDHFTSSVGAGWIVSGVSPTFGYEGTAVRAGNGKADAWTTKNVLTTPLSRVEHLIYARTDLQQMNTLLIGDPSQHIYLEYGASRYNLGIYDGAGWTVVDSGTGLFTLEAGGVISLERTSMGWMEAAYNGVVFASGAVPTSVAQGLQVGFTVRADLNFFVWWRSPSIDAIQVIP